MPSLEDTKIFIYILTIVKTKKRISKTRSQVFYDVKGSKINKSDYLLKLTPFLDKFNII